MAKKKQEEKQLKPQVNPELLQVERQYRREKMVVEARPRLKKLGLLLLIVLDVGLIAVLAIYVVTFFVSGGERRQVASIVNNLQTMNTVSQEKAADPLVVSDVSVFPLGAGDYDFYVEVENENPDWYATFDYFFSSSQGDSEVRSGSVMPSATQPLALIRQAFDARPSGPELMFENFVWHRIDGREIHDPEMWLDEHNRFTVENAEYHRDVQIDGGGIPRTSFTIVNDTPYGYWSPEFVVGIERGGRISGVNLVTIPNFGSGDIEQVDVNWFGTAPSSGDVVVTPNINYFDDEAYMPPSGNPSADLRDRF